MAGNTMTILAGYETYIGNKKMAIVDITGPNPYVNTATFSTSGQPITAAQLGWGGIEMIIGSVSSDGLDNVVIGSPTGGVAAATVNLHWFVIATAAEVANGVDLSAKTVRLVIIGV